MKRKAISKSIRFSVFARDQFTCVYCGKSPPEVKLVIDHVIPVVKGGTNDEDNLTSSCELANSYSPETIFEWIDLTVIKLGINENDDRYIKYICGIARNVRSVKLEEVE